MNSLTASFDHALLLSNSEHQQPLWHSLEKIQDIVVGRNIRPYGEMSHHVCTMLLREASTSPMSRHRCLFLDKARYGCSFLPTIKKGLLAGDLFRCVVEWALCWGARLLHCLVTVGLVGCFRLVCFARTHIDTCGSGDGSFFFEKSFSSRNTTDSPQET